MTESVTTTTLSGTIHCEKWGCTLSVKACLLRQIARRAFPAHKRYVSAYPYCASGECEQGQVVAGCARDLAVP